MPPGGKGSPLPPTPISGNPGLSRSLAAVASLGIYGGFLLGRPVPEGSGEGGVGQGGVLGASRGSCELVSFAGGARADGGS